MAQLSEPNVVSPRKDALQWCLDVRASLCTETERDWTAFTLLKVDTPSWEGESS